jgi:DNA-binding winged helix-turn-helix (wHTH) protein
VITAGTSYRFGDVELDVQRRVLLVRGCADHIQPKVFALLHFLVLHRERVVEKRVLLRELWPDAFVGEGSLTRLVKEARRAVGDDGRTQAVIETVHGIGYRFVARLHERPRSETERAIDLARRSLEAAIDLGSRDLRDRVREYAEACRVALQTALYEADPPTAG